MENTLVTTDVLESIDDFLPIAGVENIGTRDEKVKPSVFSKENTNIDLSFIDEVEKTPEEIEEEKKKKELADTSIEQITNEIDELEDDSETRGRKKIDKSGTVEVFKQLIDEKLIIPFEDDKPLEEYSVKDWKELIQANIEEKEKDLRAKTPQEFFEALPEEMQYAARYIAEGGKDIKSLFKALAQVEETKALDVNNETHQEMIARYYLQATKFGDESIVEEQIQEWKDAGTIAKKAQQFKPKLDAMEKEVVEAQIEKAEEYKKEQIARKEAYMKNVYEALKPAEFNGIKINSKRQNALWEGLTTLKEKSIVNGNPTNKLGMLLEQHQFGPNPRYDLIVQALWLLEDPDDYHETIRSKAKTDTIKQTVRELKTEEGRKKVSQVEENLDDERRKVLKKQTNIFKR